MSEELKERSAIDAAYQWDLTPLYESDAAWEAALPELEEKLAKCTVWQGRLTDAPSVLSYLEAETELELVLSDLFEYASLRKSEDTRADDAQGMYARIYNQYVKIVTATSFARPELLSLPEETLSAMMEDPCLSDYRFQLVKLLREKEHTLSKEEEVLLASLGEVFAVPKEVSENLQDADLLFEAAEDRNQKKHEVTGSNYILLQSDPDRMLRKDSFQSYYASYRNHIHTFAAAYAGAVKGAAAEAAIRRYQSSQEMSMAGEHIPSRVYQNLIDSVRAHMPAMYRYAALRKRMLQLDELHYYDVYAPLVKDSDRRYTYEEAQQMVLDTVSVLGEEYTETVRRAFAERWIDVYPNKGKSGGAYSAGTYRSNPYILTNFDGTLNSVSTLAHEMGHSMHTWYSNHTQKAQNADYTLFVAEVASTVNENLLVEKLLRETTDPKERLGYLNQYLEAFKGTVYRQCMFAEFEQKAHQMAGEGQALSASALNELYQTLVGEYFGDELVMDDEVQYEWARIPHFYRPFYVYKYATSYSAAVAISEAILTEGEAAVRRYLEFLSMGGSADPLDELAHAGVDLTTREAIDAALNKFETVVEAAEQAADELGM